MRLLPKVVALAGVFALAIAWSPHRIGVADARQEPTVVKSARGGLLAKAPHNQFEVFFFPTGLRLFPLDSAGHGVEVSKLAATATFYHPNSTKPWFTRQLHDVTAASESPASLDLVIGLRTVPEKGAKVVFEVTGLPGSGGSAVAVTVPVEFVAAPVATNPTPPPMGAAPEPRYVYGPGYNGFGYYRYPGPQSAPATTTSPTVFHYGTPGRRSSGSSSGSTRDWSTGRDLPSGGLISKPWLRPMD